ncbi:hypothetical protein AOB54_01790 [beta proteobacterium MWH-UniP1]
MSGLKQSFPNKLCLSLLIFITLSPLIEAELKAPISLALAFLGFLFRSENISINFLNNLRVLLVLFGVFVLHPIILDMENLGNSIVWIIGTFSLVFSGFILANSYTKKDFLDINESFIIVIIALGLPIYLPFSYGLFDYDLLPIYNFKGCERGYTVGIVNFLTHEYGVTARFSSFAREPGIMQVFILLALNNRIVRMRGSIDVLSLMLIVALFLGKSTTGLFAMLIVLMMSCNFYKNKIFFALFGCIFIYFFIIELKYIFDYKLFNTHAFEARYNRYEYLINTNLVDLIFGLGNNVYNETLAANDLGGFDSFLQLIQRYGIIAIFTLFLLLFLNNYNDPAPLIIILLAFFSQSLWLDPIISYFYFCPAVVKRFGYQYSPLLR